MMQRRARRRIAAMLLGLAAMAQPCAAESDRSFDIAPGPAAAALAEFARQAGIEVLATGDLLANIATKRVQGRLPLTQALDRLLEGTGLRARITEGGTVFIQRIAPPAAAAQDSEAIQEIRRVLISGQRLSERTAIERKRDANTRLDAIVSEDVGSFPDRNVAEAVSRIAGVSLERNDFGEGTHVSLRGNTPDVTRVELDGMIVPSPGGTDLTGGGGGRATEFRELPVDLISSVDVVKGATADMTEGSLGGGILIKTRTGFDFQQRTAALRASGQMNTINGKWRPNLNLLLADRFLGKRLGVVLNLSHQQTFNEAHTIKHTQDVRSAYARDVDYDGSPEKTFALNPDTLDLSQVAAHTPVNSSGSINGTYAVLDGGPPFANLSPAEIVRRSAAAQSKGDCFAAFPLGAAEFARIGSDADRANAQNHRAQELRSCLNQWNDYAPGMVRYFSRTQKEDRVNGDLRLDFKVNEGLTVYAKYNRMTHDILDTQNAISLGNLGTSSAAANFDEAPGSQSVPAVRTVNAAGAAAGLSLFPGNYNSLGIADNRFIGLYDGFGVNVVPGSLKVDGKHHVTEAVLSNAGFTNDTIAQTMRSTSHTAQFGGSYRAGRLKADFMHGRVSSDFWRYGLRSAFDFRYGPVRAYASADGLWQYDFSGGVNPLQHQLDPGLYGILGAPLAPGQPAREAARPIALTVDIPRAGEMNENNTRVDFTYRTRAQIPFVDSLKFGLNQRDFESSFWTSPATGRGTVINDGANGQPLVILPGTGRTSLLHVCEDTAQSLAPGGTPCTYGFVPNGSRNTVGAGDYYLNTTDYRRVIAQVLATNTSPFFSGARSGPATVDNWAYLDAAKLFKLLGVPPVDVGCIKACMASDGRYYEQPRTSAFEKVTAAYLSAAFALDRIPFLDVPLPWELSGNLGYRVVRTDVRARGAMTFTAITKSAGWNPATGHDAVATTTTTRNVSLVNRTHDYLPMLNLEVWPVQGRLGLRYHHGKGMARPSPAYLVPGGANCVYDERGLASNALGEDANGACDGMVGNPALRAQKNLNQELSLEWYPNRDSSVSLSLFRQKGLVGPAIRGRANSQPVFSGSDLSLPDGRSLAQVPFDYDTWVNGPANSRKGIELAGKTAFTFLPSVLRHTGIIGNLTALRSRTVEGALYELMTADPLSPVNQYRYSWNTSLWYDDGRLSMRVALQVNTQAFTRYQTGLPATRPYPAPGIDMTSVLLPLLPPTSSFRDARRFVDARVAYRFGKGVEVFLEGRNLGNKSITNSMGAYGQYEHGRSLLDLNYSGIRILAGLVLRL